MKSYSLSLTDLSQEDIYTSQDFYETQSPNLGIYFYDSIIVDLDALKFYAGIHQKYFGFYRMITKRFPYAIYYDIEDDLVVVHAVLHTRKDLSFIEERLTKS
ncbi:MAG TPA: type II toxin-antitoxin system RelE/ParE family toxin [Arcobacter sp.]|nr:type II toxin-antitoxin system RelE/ParE family toxin [Arcobacter sp.]